MGDVMSEKILQAMWRAQLLASPRFQQPKRLQQFGWKALSQNEEDGMLFEVFRRIGIAENSFIEFGVETGLECNSAALLLHGWRGTWVEASPEYALKARENFAPYADRLTVREQRLNADNVDAILKEHGLTYNLDLLSIDTDYNDYWLWRAITSAKPRVVVIEYNATYPPPMSISVAYNPDGVWEGGTYHGASLAALTSLGAEKGYTLVGCCLAGVNAFFVRNDLVGDHFHAPFTAEEHYEPPRYSLVAPAGHPPQMGDWVRVGAIED